jgi:hypothetical protein
MSASDDGGVHEPQLPQRSPGFVEGGFVKRGCVGGVVGGPCGAVSSVVTFLIIVFVGAQFNGAWWWALVGTGFIAIVGAGVGAIFGAVSLAAKPTFELAVIGGGSWRGIDGRVPALGRNAASRLVVVRSLCSKRG